MKEADEEQYGAEERLWPEEGGEPTAALVGTIFGALMQAYHVGDGVNLGEPFTFDDVSLEDSHPATCDEARRLYRAHVEEYRKDAFGTIIGSELRIEIPESLFGLKRTGAIDLVAARPDGIWIIDSKTAARDFNLEEQFGLDLQLWVYALGYELLTGLKPVGVEVAACIKTKIPKFRRIAYDGLTDQRFAWLKLTFDELRYQMANPRPQPSLNNCKQYNRACKYLEGTMCSLIK